VYVEKSSRLANNVGKEAKKIRIVKSVFEWSTVREMQPEWVTNASLVGPIPDIRAFISSIDQVKSF
jgi:hypothetical protein